MQADDEKMFLENIEEFVMDEDKIVTYKWLSATLDVHVNTAKQLLYKYAMPDNKRKDGVHMTYLVAGALADGSGMKIQIVRETDLDRVKSQFKVVTSEHVYSVQKATHLPDLNILYGVDNLENEKNYEDRFGSIRFRKAVRRLGNDIKSLQIKATTVSNNPVSSSKNGSSVSSLDKVAPEPVTAALPPSSKAMESDPSKPAESKSSSSPSIASLFTAQSKAVKNNNRPVAAASKPATKKTKSGGIAMFFTKHSEKQTINKEHKETLKESKAIAQEDNIDKMLHSVETTVPTDNNELVSTKEKLNIQVDVDKEEKTNRKSYTTKQKKGTTSPSHKVESDITKGKKGKTRQKVEITEKQTSSSGRGKKKKSSEKSQPAKKRKRIMVISDDSASSDEDIFGNDSDTEIRPPSPEILPEVPPKSHSSDEDVIPSTPISQQVRNGKVRKRKLVDKTFEDKDGFIMTKKEYVFESCSEDDGDHNKDKQSSNVQIVDLAENGKNPVPNGEINEDVEKDKPKNQAKGGKQSRKKKSLPSVGQKSKQSTLMSFFNKNN